MLLCPVPCKAWVAVCVMMIPAVGMGIRTASLVMRTRTRTAKMMMVTCCR